MARPGATQRPSYIALPTPQYTRSSPNGSPSGTPAPLASPTSPRSSFLPSFIRNRSRAATITGRSSPRVEQADPIARAGSAATGSAAVIPPPGSAVGNAGRDGGGVTRSVSTPSGALLANGTSGVAATGPVQSSSVQSGPTVDPKGKTHRIRLVPHLETSRSLAFDPVVREVFPIAVRDGISPSAAAASISTLGPLVNGKPPALLLKIGRFTDKAPAAGEDGHPDRPATGIGGATIAISGGGGEVTSGKVAFKSKVVSRNHAEIWCEAGGKFFIRDTSSSSGTFLNHIRLSSPNTESRPTQINDGDVLQLGVDYQGGHEDQFRCVKMRVEVGREWQRAANEFNTNAIKQLKALGGAAPATPEGKGKGVEGTTPGSISKKSNRSVTDCCICLFSVTVCQSLFIAPCSHVFHYKCIRPLLMQHHPGFSCPLCRTYANLEEDVETEDAFEIASRRASVISRRPSNHSIRLTRNEASQASPADADGAPSSNIESSGAAMTVEELLTGDNGSTSEEGGHTADESRQDTILNPAGVPGPEASEGGGGAAASSRRSSADSVSGPMRNLGIDIAPTVGSSRRSSGIEPLPTAAIPDVQTPMNDYFLSTLASGSMPVVAPPTAAGMPGMLQQLQRAEAVSTIPEETSSTSSRAHAAEVTLADDLDEGESRRRAESEMMR